MVVTVVITGIPKNVTIGSLALSLDQLFDTNEISSFRTRNLPLNAKGKPQVALDFKSGFDAMAAQEILNGYTYAIDDQEYILRAKVTKDPSLMESDSSATPDREIERHGRGRKRRSHASDDIDAELTYLKKKLLVVESEKILIKAQKKVKKLKKKIKNKLSDSEAEVEGEPSKKKKKKKKELTRIKRSKSKRSSTSRRRSSSRDSASGVSGRTPSAKETMKSRNRSSSLSSVSSWPEQVPKMKEITFPVEKKSRSKNRSSSPISISSDSEESSPRRKISSPVKRRTRTRSRSQETLALVPYGTSSERSTADTRRHTPQPSTSRATERDSSRKRTSRNKSPKMPERRRLRSRSQSRSRSPVGRRSPRKRLRSRSRSPVGRRSPKPSSSRHRASPRRSSRWSPMRRRSRSTSRPRYKDYGGAHKEMVFVARAHRVYQPDNYNLSVTEVDSDHTDAISAGVDDVPEEVPTDKTEVEEKKEEPKEDTKIVCVIKMNVIKKKSETDAESIKKIMPVPMLLDDNSIKKESEEVQKKTGDKVADYDPEFIKKIMPRPIVLDGEIIKKEVDDRKKEKPKKKMPLPIRVEMDSIKREITDTENENPIATERNEPKTTYNANKKPASNPQFHIPIIKIVKQMRPLLEELGEDLKSKVIEVARVRLIARIKEVLTGQPYMNNTAVCAFYRKHFPLESDEEFLTSIKEDIANGECDDIIMKNDGQCAHILRNNRNGKRKKRACQVVHASNDEWRKELSLGHFLLNLREMVQSMKLDSEEKSKQNQNNIKIKKERSESKKASSDRKTNKKSSKDRSKVVPVGPDDDVVILEKLPEVINLSENEDDCGVMQAIIKLENDLECTDLTQTHKKNKSDEIKKARKLQKIQNKARTPEKIVEIPEMSIEEIKNEREFSQVVSKSEKVQHTDLPRTDKKRKEKKEKRLKKSANTDRKAADVIINVEMSEDQCITSKTTEANESPLKPSKKRSFDDFNDTPMIDIKHEQQQLSNDNAPHVNVAVKEEYSDQREKTATSNVLEPNISKELTLDAIDDALMNEIKQELQHLPNTMLTNDDSEKASNVEVAVKKESGHQIEKSDTSNDLKPNISKEQTFNTFNDALMNEVKQELKELPETILQKTTSTDIEEVKTELVEPEECIESIENFVTLVTNVIDID